MGANCLNESQCDEIAERSLNQQIEEYLEEEEDMINCENCNNECALCCSWELKNK